MKKTPQKKSENIAGLLKLHHEDMKRYVGAQSEIFQEKLDGVVELTMSTRETVIKLSDDVGTLTGKVGVLTGRVDKLSDDVGTLSGKVDRLSLDMTEVKMLLVNKADKKDLRALDVRVGVLEKAKK
ncbi:MAG: hypothetical protein ABI430_00445 [Candidatus Taylorbacteria bacterium]